MNPASLDADVDLSDPATFVPGVPHEAFRLLRETDPVHWQEETGASGTPKGPGYWALTRYADVAHVSKHPALFSSERGTSVLGDLAPRDRRNMRQQLIHMDAPVHTRLRKIMTPYFKPRAVGQMESYIRQIACETLDVLQGRSECDFVEDVSAPISLRALTHFLGIPDKDTKKLYHWTNKLIGSSDPEVSSQWRGRLAVLEIFIHGAFLRRKRRKKPTDDIYSALIHGQIDGAPLGRLMLDMNYFLLIIAGNETTRNALSGGVQALCEHPDQLERLRCDPTLLPQALEEMLRWVTPVMQFRRTATRDTRIGDQEIREGDKVVMYYGAANRDPDVFEQPEVFDITRSPNPHLAFGTGAHFCAGSHMARLEMRVTLEELLRRFPDIQLAGPIERLCSNFISGIKAMPVALG